MLTELRVRDLGVIEDLALTFGPGMTALTGETGAGKTMLVEALHLVLGGRGDGRLVRAGAAEALVEARFVVGMGLDAHELVLAHAVPAQGRSRAWVDTRMAPLAALGEAAAELVEIHGQHEHRALVTPAAQSRVLDTFAGTDLGPLRALRRQLRDLDDALAAIGGDEEQRAREADVLRYQLEEIRAAGIEDPDEEVGLRSEEERLSDAAAYREAAQGAAELLDARTDGPDAGEGALDLIGRAGAALAGRESFGEYQARLVSAGVELADLARTLRDAVEEWGDDPVRLEQVQTRRRLLADLRRKYGKDLHEVLAFAAVAQKRLDALEDADGAALRLSEQRGHVLDALQDAESAVRAARTGAAPSFGILVGERLATLAMTGARLEVRVAPGGSGEPVTLDLAANLGEPAQPLARAASGGELARAMLAIRLVGLGGPQTMVFDEVDAGVGGTAALALGQALREVAGDRQVLVVTHLAQVAAQADAQISVVKREAGGRTVTAAAVVEGEDRVTELSRMLSGHPGSDAARRHARELLEAGRRS